MHRARAILQAAFYDYPVEDLYSLVFHHKGDTVKEYIKGMGYTVSVRDEDTNMASCRLDVSRLELHEGDLFGQCFDLVADFSHDVLVVQEDGSLNVNIDHLLKWREMTKMLGEELFMIAYLAKNDNGLRTDFCWQDVTDVDCPWLDGALKNGVCDIHSHLNASYDAFLVNWIGLMNQIVGKSELFDQLAYPKDNPVVLRDYHFSSLYSWCILAAKIRSCLYEFFVVGGKEEDWFLEEMEAYSELHSLTYYNALVVNTENSLIAERKLSEIRYQKDDIFDYAIDLNMGAGLLDSPFAVLSGERRIEYGFMRAYFQEDFSHSKILQLAYLYERIKVEVRKELVQTNRKTGLVNFKLYDSSKNVFSRQEKHLKNVLRTYGIQSSLEKSNHYLEGRICTCDAPVFLKQGYKQGILSKTSLDRYNGRLTYVIHLTKCGTLGTNRFEEKRRKGWLKEINEFLFLRAGSPLFTGIDFAGTELYTRPETAAHTIRYARSHGVNHITYHVGEDYYDLADGLRAIDECVRFCEMDEFCRLGHAMAMGVNARTYYRQNDYEIVLPKQYHLDNMIWMLQRSRDFRLHLDDDFEGWLLSESEKIYTEIGYIGRFSFDNYYASMMLRGDDDLEYTGGALKVPNGNNRWENTKLLKGIDELRNNGAAQRLYFNYLRNNRIIEKGIEPIKVKITNDYIKQIIRLQKAVCRMVADKGICVECNLTSNVLISNIKRYDAHPIGKYRKIKGMTDRVLKVVLGTDDKGVFATSLYNEYALLVTSIMKKKRKQGYDGWFDQRVADFIKHIAENSMKYKF